MLSHLPEMGQHSISKSAKNVLPSHKILRIQLAPEHQEVNITACTHQLRHIGKIIQTRCSGKTPQHSLWILSKAEKRWTMKRVNAWPLAYWLWLYKSKTLQNPKTANECEIWSAKHLWVLANRGLFPDFRETRPQRCVRDWGYLVFFCTSRLQTKPTLSNSNIAYTSMSWCAKFHCIISKTRYLIYGHHIRPKRSRLRRCDPAVQLLTHGYTDTAKAANQRRQNGSSAKLQYILR